MKKVLGLFFSCLQWIILALIALEILCFLLVTAGNYLVFGHAWEGSRVRYDPYALFVNVDGPRPTAHNPPPRFRGATAANHLAAGGLHHAGQHRP